jgi:hypothetical protein
MSEKIVLSKDSRGISIARQTLFQNLEIAQSRLNWFNSIEFTPKLKTINEVKDFLENPQFHYDIAV